MTEFDLVQTLKGFNRKERYWVIRNALGHEGEDLPLSDEFRSNLGKAISRTIPADAWWAMDYHFDWLFATALLLQDPARNTGSNMKSGRPLIEGNQRDVDLVVAFGTTIVALEAKCTTGWSIKQNDSKFERLQRLTEMLRDKVELVQVFWAPDKINQSSRLGSDSFKLPLWMDRQNDEFSLINRDTREGRNWIIHHSVK